jgi:hypothetical protein
VVKRLSHSQDASFEADNGACAVASLLDLQIVETLRREDVGVSLSIIGDRGVNIFWGPLSGYDLKRLFDHPLATMWAAAQSQIY